MKYSEIAGETVPDWRTVASMNPAPEIVPAPVGGHAGPALCPTDAEQRILRNDNGMLKIKNYSLVMKIMSKAVELTIAEGSGDKKDYANPEFQIRMNSSAA